MDRQKRRRAFQDIIPSGLLGKGWLSLRKTFEWFWKRKIFTLVLFLCVFAVFCGYYYIRNLNTASATLSLDYEEASKGLTPGHTRFNISEIESAEVLEKLIDYAGLQEVITADELRECIRVKATHDKNVSGKENYICTSYSIQFTGTGKIQKRTAETMLSLLCKTYREFFADHYGVNHSILSFDISNLKYNDEYLMIVDLLELKCSQLEKYVALRTRENKNYQDPDTGITFAALEQRVTNFFTYDLARLRSFIIEAGIANDKPGLNAMLEYKTRMDRIVYRKLMAAYDEDSKGIQMYDSAMSAVVMIPTVDKTSKYYMSRTKTGMDNMAIHADEQLAGAMEKKEDINYNTYLLEKMQTNSPSAAQCDKADAMIRQIESSLETLASDIRKVDKAYSGYKSRNYLSFQIDRSRFVSRIDPVSSISLAVLVLAVAFTLVFLYYFIGKRDKKA